MTGNRDVYKRQEMTCAQLNHKKECAYVAADLSAYLVGRRMEKLTKNPFQSDWQEGVVLLNPVGMPMPVSYTHLDVYKRQLLRISGQREDIWEVNGWGWNILYVL